MSRLYPIAAMLACLALIGCSGQNQAPTPQQQAAQRKAAAEAKAQQKKATYDRLIQLNNYPLAVPVGEEIVRDYPGTKAAAEVAKSLPRIKAEGQARAEKQRLQRLWTYQVGPMAGGTQSTAAIESSRPTGSRQVRLVLRRHTKWGQSAYLFASGKGFVCHDMCRVAMSFDGHHRSFKAYKPDGSEPALFINDDKAFIRDMEKAKRITMHVDLADGGKTELLYEVGGFDPGQWQPVHKGGK
jgi:hypothetical protein